ncbi:MAG: NAD(P)H-dependent oxidoreductase [Promethearchaeota archaeon]
MKITVINGSPKTAESSTTITFIRYIQKMFPSHTFQILNVGLKLTRMKIKEKSFLEMIEAIRYSDGVIWTFPVYTMLIPAQLKRFIELIWEKNVQDAFENKYSAVLSTSLNFYDHTAHNYLHAIIDDLNMKYVGFYSAQMDNLLDPNKRKNWYRFIVNFFYYIKNNIPVSKRYRPLEYSNFIYEPREIGQPVNNSRKKVTLLTDVNDPSSNLAKMITQFKNAFKDQSLVEIINLNDIDIKGGCLGCIKCGFENQCVYKDGYVQFFREKIMNKPIMIFAAEIKDRYYSYKWKLYFDRMFHNGHTPSLRGTQMGFLISGPLNQVPNLRELISAQVECGQANLVDVITDELEDSNQIDILIHNLATNLIRLSDLNYVAPPTFLEVGGFKIFRDLIYGIGRIPFPSDYKFFKRNKMFDFPTKDWKMVAFGRMASFFFKFKKIRVKFQKIMGKAMIMGPERFLKKMNLEKEKKLLDIRNT